MTDAWLPYGKQQLDEDDVAAVVAVLRGDWLTTGPAVPAFEAALARVGQAPFAAAVSSGTAALHAAYSAAGLTARRRDRDVAADVRRNGQRGADARRACALRRRRSGHRLARSRERRGRDRRAHAFARGRGLRRSSGRLRGARPARGQARPHARGRRRPLARRDAQRAAGRIAGANHHVELSSRQGHDDGRGRRGAHDQRADRCRRAAVAQSRHRARARRIPRASRVVPRGACPRHELPAAGHPLCARREPARQARSVPHPAPRARRALSVRPRRRAGHRIAGGATGRRLELAPVRDSRGRGRAAGRVLPGAARGGPRRAGALHPGTSASAVRGAGSSRR